MRGMMVVAAFFLMAGTCAASVRVNGFGVSGSSAVVLRVVDQTSTGSRAVGVVFRSSADRGRAKHPAGPKSDTTLATRIIEWKVF